MGCGARSSLRAGDGGAGGLGATGASVTGASVSASSTSGGGTLCLAWTARAPLVPLAPGGVASREELGFGASGDVALTFIAAPPGENGPLVGGTLDAFSTWPPSYAESGTIVPSARGYVVGDGASGRVALVAPSTGPLALAKTFFPGADVMGQQTPGDEPLFAAGITDRWLYGASQPVAGKSKIDTGSYQSGSLEQSEAPTTCVTSTPLARAVRAGQGFVGAFAMPNPGGGACGAKNFTPATVVTFFGYDAPTAPGSFLTSTEGDHLVFPEPIAKLELSRTSNGAWAFAQTDGSTSEQVPGVLGARVDARGHLTPLGSVGQIVVPDGAATGPIASAAWGDAAVIAWVGGGDPSLSTISARTVAPDGTLGAPVTFSSKDLPPTGRLRALVSADGRSVLLGWESVTSSSILGLARLDCASP